MNRRTGREEKAREWNEASIVTAGATILSGDINRLEEFYYLFPSPLLIASNSIHRRNP